MILHQLSATEAVALFRAKELSPVELTRAVIERAEETEPTVNALCHRFFDEAIDAARAAERRYVRRGTPPRPLEGVPLAIKEEEAVAGQPWTQGALLHRDLVADHTSVMAQRMIDAGAIVHARTTAPEFSAAAYTRSELWGITRNPWNPLYAVGGSSGGSGAALAAGSTVLASGSDIAGSIRIPASANGVVGFKPPYGRVPADAPWNLDTFCHSGPMARTVADCALLQNVIAGPHPADGVSLRPRYELPLEPAGIEGLRIAVSPDLGDWLVDPAVRRNTAAVADLLRAAGATVEETDLTIPRAATMRCAGIHFSAAFTAWIDEQAAAHPGLVSRYSADLPGVMRALAADGTFLDELEIVADVQGRLGALLERYDALVCPTAGTTGLLADEDYVDRPAVVAGEATRTHLEAMLTLPFNLASRHPVLAVPSGRAPNGVPTGVQIVGRTYDDAVPFRIGAALERLRPPLGEPSFVRIPPEVVA
ncbi:amidase [Patulibacter sp. S7RM1-6]